MEAGATGQDAAPEQEAARGAGSVIVVKVFAIVALLAAVGISFALILDSGGMDRVNSGGLWDVVVIFGGMGAAGMALVVGGAGIVLNLPRTYGLKGSPSLISVKSALYGSAVGLLVVAGAASSGLALTARNVLLSVLYAMSVLLFIEFGHATIRFNEISNFIRENRVTDMRLGSVITAYLVKGLVILGIVALISLAILFVNLGLAELSFLPEILVESVELNSIYGLAVTMVFVIGLSAVIIALATGWPRDIAVLKGWFAKEEAEEF